MVIKFAESPAHEDAVMRRVRGFRLEFILPLLLVSVSCTPQARGTMAGPQVKPNATSNYPLFRADLARADTVVVARLTEAFPEKLADHFIVTARWEALEVLSGSLATKEISTRLPFDARGWKSDGPLPPEATILHKNRNYVLLLSRDLYQKSVAARKGTPQQNVTGVSLGYYLLSGSRIQSGSAYETPPDLLTLRRILGER